MVKLLKNKKKEEKTHTQHTYDNMGLGQNMVDARDHACFCAAGETLSVWLGQLAAPHAACIRGQWEYVRNLRCFWFLLVYFLANFFFIRCFYVLHKWSRGHWHPSSDITSYAVHPQRKQNRVYSLNAVHLIGAHSNIQIYMRRGSGVGANGVSTFFGAKFSVPDEKRPDILYN